MTRAPRSRPGPSDEPVELSAVVEPERRRRSHALRLGGRLRFHLGVDAVREAEQERDLEHDQHEHEHVRERGEEAEAEAQRSSSGEANRKPTPRTVWM